MLTVTPLNNIYAVFCAGADKSITIRAVLLAAFCCKKISEIHNPLVSQDTLAALDCAAIAGAQITREKNDSVWIINPTKKIPDNCVFDCKNSATTARLLIGLLTGLNITATVTGDKSLSARPMDRIIHPLTERGAKFADGNTLPLTVLPAKLNKFTYKMPVDSAQVKSCILLSGLTSKSPTCVIEKNKTRAHTENLLAFSGCDITKIGKTITLKPSNLQNLSVKVPSDPSSAAFYVALGIIKGEVTVPDICIQPQRFGFYKKIINAGGQIKLSKKHTLCGESCATVTATKSALSHITVLKKELPSLIDELPVLALIGAYFNGITIFDAGELRIKESDRFTEIINLVNAFGGKACANGNDIIIEGNTIFKRFSYDSDDHRMVMTAFIAMLVGKGGVIKNEDSVDVSFPDFFKNFYQTPMCLIGENISYSISNKIHKFILTNLKAVNFYYEHLPLQPNALANFFKKCPYRSINVTIPYKESVLNYIKKRSEDVNITRSANLIIDGKALSYDGQALLISITRKNIAIKNTNILVIGAGGAGRSIAYAFAASGAKVYMQNRSAKRLDDFLKNVQSTQQKLFIKKHNGEQCDVIINATAAKEDLPTEEKYFAQCKYAAEINYGKKTAFLKTAEKYDIPCEDGEEMLFLQAYLTDCHLLNKKPRKSEALRLYFKWRSYENNNY